MIELIASSSDADKKLQYSLENGKSITLGRAPRDGLSIPWDSMISREHAELLVNEDEVVVRRIHAARNPIHFRGKENAKFTISIGQDFVIGKTTFRLRYRRPQADGVTGSFGNYRIKSRLGEGALGQLFGAYDVVGRTSVALKLYPKENSASTQLTKRFMVESQNAVRLRSANIAYTYEGGQDRGQLFVAREFVQGKSLAEIIKRRGTFNSKPALDLVKQVAHALREIHALQMVHRNLKPTNIIVRLGNVRLTDIGCAFDPERMLSQNILKADIVERAVDYLSPEAVEPGFAADIRSDLYSLGCVWYEMLTGRAPFPDGSIAAKLAAHAKSPPPYPRVYNSSIDEGSIGVITRLLAKSADDRYQTPIELLRDLESQHVTGFVVICENCGK
jgi:serine/threonine protein kinase